VLTVDIFSVFGRSISPLELSSLLGSSLFVVSAFAVFWNCGWSARMATVASLLIWVYYSVAGTKAILNILWHGSSYPAKLFMPLVFLVASTLYSLVIVVGSKVSPGFTSRSLFNIICVCLVAVGGYLLCVYMIIERPVQIDLLTPRRIITLPMSWNRGGLYDPPNTVVLTHSSGSEECVAVFRSSAELARYVESFDGHAVPVVCEVFGDPPRSEVILRVGEWPWNRLPKEERMLMHRSKGWAAGPVHSCLQ